MTRIIDEQLSALFDGELPIEQEAMLLRRLERDPESRDKLARYGLVGELVRDASAQSTSATVSAALISERVSAAIAAETMPNETVAPALSPASNSLGLVGAAIAVSIALVVIFNLTEMSNISPLPGVTATNLVAHDDHASSPRLMRYLVSHAQFSNSTSRQLVDSHVVMAAVSPSAWSSYE